MVKNLFFLINRAVSKSILKRIFIAVLLRKFRLIIKCFQQLAEILFQQKLIELIKIEQKHVHLLAAIKLLHSRYQNSINCTIRQSVKFWTACFFEESMKIT